MSQTDNFLSDDAAPSSIVDKALQSLSGEPLEFRERNIPGEFRSHIDPVGSVLAGHADLRETEHLGRRKRNPERKIGFEARIAQDPQTRRDAYRLRHLCYASKGYIDPRSNGQFSDEYDASPENTSVVIYEDGQAVGSVRVCTMNNARHSHGARDLPVASVFPEDMEGVLSPDRSAVEINRLVCHPSHPQAQGLVFVLIRMADYVIRRHDPDLIASCVRTNHVPFYKRLRFEQVAGPRLYTGLKFMTNFMVLQRERCDMVRRIVPVLRISPGTATVYENLWFGESVPVFGHD